MTDEIHREKMLEVSIKGVTGAGKTTLIALMKRAIEESGGNVILGGEDEHTLRDYYPADVPLQRTVIISSQTTDTGNKLSGYGWRPDMPDPRDHKYGALYDHEVKAAAALPKAVSLRKQMPRYIFDQGDLGSCTANALNMAFDFVHGGGPYSRLHTYYYERQMEGTIGQDAGAEIRDGIKVLAQLGVGHEKLWPYNIRKFSQAPAKVELTEAEKGKIVQYLRLSNAQEFRSCLAAGFPFVVGITIFPSFEGNDVADTGLVPMPSGEKPIGGHAVCVIGYNDNYHGGRYYEVRNSWGVAWGDQGHFWLPAKYLEDPNMADDAWTIRSCAK